MSKVVILQTSKAELQVWRDSVAKPVSDIGWLTVTQFYPVAETLIENEGPQLLIVNPSCENQEVTKEFVEKMKEKNPALIAGNFSPYLLYGDPFDFCICVKNFDSDAFQAVQKKIEQFLRREASTF